MKFHEITNALPTSFKVVKASVDSKWGQTDSGHVVSATNVAKSVANGVLTYVASTDSYKVNKHSFLSQQGILLFSENAGTINPTFG